MLRVENLSMDYGGVRALTNVSFSVSSGDRLAIIGPNGAGKTTLFNVLNGQLRPTGGRILFLEKDITKMPVHSRTHLGLGRSFQITSLFPKLSVLANALLALQGTRPYRFQMFRPISANRRLLENAERLLESENLWEKRNAPVHSISYGEQRRLEIALSLASDPKLLLLDEPSCGLTANESLDIVKRIRELGHRISIIVVDHDMHFVFGVAKRIILLHYGEAICEGNCEEIRNSPKVKEIYMGTAKC